MSEEFKIEIVNPEKSFLVKEDVLEVVVPAFEGEMGILKDHISIISFLKLELSKFYLNLEMKTIMLKMELLNLKIIIYQF
jgi:F0F1-type ATP synthase epsilon subunit